ncbi:MAG: ParB/RepB/Spo0J family partition protein [Burkholderiaceae bacterium]|nr:ParB/RepB/Spo0J family partition protein [Burkholderiaceae bacterium]
MSTKSKLLALTGDLQLPADNVVATPGEDKLDGTAEASGGQSTKFPPVGSGATSRTGPGQMLQFRGQMLAAESELGKLRERMKEHEGAAPTKKIDPRCITASRWANRHPDSFNTAEFARLKQDIEIAGGNVQPILVRVLAGQSERYEIVFGHRRHRACAELGIPVLATIDSSAISDLDLFSTMDRENRERADLSPYEQGTMYRRALDEKLFPSNRRLAEALGVSHTWVANVLQVADLPPPVLDCFRSPLEVQHRHANAIATALTKDRKAVLRRAEKLWQQQRQLVPAGVVTALVGAPDHSVAQQTGSLEVRGKSVGKWFTDGAGRLTIQLDAEAAPAEHIEGIIRSVEQALAR